MSSQYVNRNGDVITTFPASAEHEYTPEDFGWLCPEGHYDCADVEDGPCMEDHYFGPEWEQEMVEAIKKAFGV